MVGLRGRVGAGEERFAAGFGFGAEVVELDVAEHGSLDPGKRKEEMRVEVGDGRGFGGLGARGLAGQMDLGLDLGEGEGTAWGCRKGEGVDPGAAGVAEAEQLGDLVVGFAGGVVDGAADEGVVPGAVGGTGEIEMGVAAGDDEGEGLRVVGLVEPVPLAGYLRSG